MAGNEKNGQNERQIRPADGKPSDGKGRGPSYPDDVKRRARVYYSLGYSFSEIGSMMGIKRQSVYKWKQREQPGGKDWDTFKAGLDISPLDRAADRHPASDEWEQREQWLKVSRRLMDIAVEAMEGRVLYDEEGELVENLYTETGRKVPLTGMRPASMTELVRAIDIAEKIGGGQIKAMKELQDDYEDKETLFRHWWMEALPVIEEVFGKEKTRELVDLLQSGKLLGVTSGEPEIEVVDGEVVRVEGEDGE